MAAPRVFLSSTYYDLKHVRSDIADFIRGLGYSVVQNENLDIPYSQKKELEYDCYSEILTCDIVVCVIGNSFGTESTIDEMSITMHELEQALKVRKLVYVFVEKSVFIENKTYIKNVGLKDFTPDAVNDIKIHKYIKELKEKMGRSRPIIPFETVHEIVHALKNQFAGLFQSFLAASAANAEQKAIGDLCAEVERLKEIVADIIAADNSIVDHLSSTILLNNPTISLIERYLGIKQFHLDVRNIYALDEAMSTMGFEVSTSDDNRDEYAFGLPISDRVYSKKIDNKMLVLTISKEAFKESGEVAIVKDKKQREKLVEYYEEDDALDMPF